MGRQIIGGTRSKIRGKVGTEIYQVKSESGKYVQHVYAAPTTRENPNTEKQAKARMIMGQIQRMFHALPDIIKDAWVDVPRGRISFQKFAQVNRPLLVDDVENHWDANCNFDWQAKYSVLPPAGEWILTKGDIPGIISDDYRCTAGENNEFEWTFEGKPYLKNYGQLLSRLSMTRESELHIIFYQKKATYKTPQIVDIVLTPNPIFDDDTPLAFIGDNEFFLHSSPWDVIGLPTYGKEEFSLEIYKANPGETYYVACCAIFVVQRDNGKSIFSSSTFRWAEKKSFYYIGRSMPADVWSSWLNK